MGRVAFVTGAGRGIGRAIATELGRAGASVVLSYRTGAEDAESLAAEIGGRALQADVSDADSARALVEEAGDVEELIDDVDALRPPRHARFQSRRELAQPIVSEPPAGAGRPRDERAFGQALQIDRRVVPAPAQLPHRRRERHPAVAFAAIVHHEPTIDHRHEIENLAVLGAHQPVDARPGNRPPDRRRHRNGVNDIAERAQTHQQKALQVSGPW